MRNKILWFIALFLILIISSAIFFGYTKSFLEGIFIGLHGVFIEIFLIVIIFEAIQQRIRLNEVNKVLTVIKPKINRILEEYEYILETIGQDKDSVKLTWSKLSKVDFLKKPNAEPFSGNLADFIRWSIERNEERLNNILSKYSRLLNFSLLKNLESLIGHEFILDIKFIPDVILMNDGYIKFHGKFCYFALFPDQKRFKFEKDFENLRELIADTGEAILK